MYFEQLSIFSEKKKKVQAIWRKIQVVVEELTLFHEILYTNSFFKSNQFDEKFFWLFEFFAQTCITKKKIWLISHIAIDINKQKCNF